MIWSWSADRKRASELRQQLQAANAGWSVRVLTAADLGVYLDLTEIWPGRREQVDARAAQGILRLALLHEYGGVWLDGNVELLEPLEDWIEAGAADGFFAFADTAGRPSSALLACAEGNQLVASWLLAALEHVGSGQTLQTDWLEQAFAGLADRDRRVSGAWDSVARLPLRSSDAELTLGSSTAPAVQHAAPPAATQSAVHLRTRLRDVRCAGISVSTKNVGDHIQLLGLEDILRRQGFAPSVRLDRDRDLAGGDWLQNAPENLPILINGWLMHRPAAWPPHPRLDATLFGVFFQIASAPHLVEQPALDYYSTRPAIGCRDPFTMNLLRNRGVDAYLSHCASMGLPRRLPDQRQTETFVVAPDEALLTELRSDPGFMATIGDDAVALSHYTDSADFEANIALARDLLETYRTRARLIVTTMLHCALPAIAMGIPVIVIAPLDLYKHETDVARLSDLGRFVRIFEISELEHVDWSGYRVDTGALKVAMVDQVGEIVASWGGDQLPEPGTAAEPQSIPKVFHRIWLGGPMPDEVKRWGETWLEHNPGWTMTTWGEEDLRDLVNQSYFDNARNYSEQSDFARYEILLRHGGIYLDTDFECYKNIEPLLAGLDAFLACEDDVLVCGAIVGATPNNPLIRELVERLPASYDAFPGMEPRAQSERCGPRFVTRVYQELQAGAASTNRLHVYPPEYFFPHLWWERERSGEHSPKAYARHYWEASWVPATTEDPNDEHAEQTMNPSRDVVVVLPPDLQPDDWPEIAGVAHLLVGTGTKLTIAAPAAALTAAFIDYLRVMDERLGGTIEIELIDTGGLDGPADLVIPLDEAADAVCGYLQSTGRAWLPLHHRVVAAVTDARAPVATQPAAAPPAPQPAVRADVPEPERIRELAQLELPDVKRWGDIENYPEGWNPRAHLAADMIDDGVKLLEIGVGAGYFKSITEDRVLYTGVDLAPVIPQVQEFNLESDELPEARYDCIVALGVLEYVHDLPRAVSLLTAGADMLVLSYCFAEPGFQSEDHRLGLGWVNGLQEGELFEMFGQHGFSLRARQDYNGGEGWHQVVFRLQSGA
jgi:mannosyltransferase OCH1-like enzyme